MDEMKTMVIADWSEALYSKAAVPGGGGASANAGAMAAALGGMVANLTTGKKKYAQYQEDIEVILEKTDALRIQFLDLMQKDAESFEPLSKAYGLPKETEEEIAYKEQVMEEALKNASVAPLQIMAVTMELLPILEELMEKGSKIALSDVGVALAMSRAALTGAAMNVFINTKLMKNREMAESFEAQADEWLEIGCNKIDLMYTGVMEALRK